MQRSKRVYPSNGFPGKWLSYLLLFLSAVVLLSGLVWNGTNDELDISLSATPTPIPTNEAFDETVQSREIQLPSSSWYALQLGAFENESSANELANQFMQRGAAGYVWHDGRYRTLAAIYPTKEDAQYVRLQLSEQHTIDSYLYEIALPQLTLRLQGMGGQLDILEAAFIHANDLAVQLQAISVVLDRQEMNNLEIITQLNDLKSQMNTISLRLQQRFTAPQHQTVTGLIACFDQFSTFCSQLNQNDSAVSLARDIKRQTFSTLELLKEVYDQLGTT